MIASGGGGDASSFVSLPFFYLAAVVLEVRVISGLGLKEAKEAVEGAPKVIKEAVAKDEAEAIKAKLEEVGATVTIK